MRALPFILSAILILSPGGVLVAAASDVELRSEPAAAEELHGSQRGRRGRGLVETFRSDPASSRRTVIRGAALERVRWHWDAAAFPGDPRGSLEANYDSNAAAGLLGFPLRRSLSERDAFHAAAVFVIRSEGYAADPDGFFQISWGLWNSLATGLDRTGNPTAFATDTFELVGFDWFPNVSPLFGGPFLGPSVFGAADVNAPSFDALGAFANAALVFDTEAGLPLDRPLIAVLEHRPAQSALVVSVHRIVDRGVALPVPSAVTVVDLGQLGLREYELDTLGLTLWNDGFGGATPAVQATVDFHGLLLLRGRLSNVEALLRALR